MLQLRYYLVHKDTERRLKYYKTLQGARIAQRHRNHKLGFLTRIERVLENNWEIEMCLCQDGLVREGTYCIVEDLMEVEDNIYV